MPASSLFRTTHPWHYLENLEDSLPGTKLFVKNVKESTKSLTGRTRVFLRKSLNESSLLDYINALCWNKQLTSKYYEEYSFLRSSELHTPLISFLEMLIINCTFNLPLIDPIILEQENYWNKALHTRTIVPKKHNDNNNDNNNNNNNNGNNNFSDNDNTDNINNDNNYINKDNDNETQKDITNKITVNNTNVNNTNIITDNNTNIITDNNEYSDINIQSSHEKIKIVKTKSLNISPLIHHKDNNNNNNSNSNSNYEEEITDLIDEIDILETTIHSNASSFNSNYIYNNQSLYYDDNNSNINYDNDNNNSNINYNNDDIINNDDTINNDEHANDDVEHINIENENSNYDLMGNKQLNKDDTIEENTSIDNPTLSIKEIEIEQSKEIVIEQSKEIEIEQSKETETQSNNTNEVKQNKLEYEIEGTEGTKGTKGTEETVISTLTQQISNEQIKVNDNLQELNANKALSSQSTNGDNFLEIDDAVNENNNNYDDDNDDNDSDETDEEDDEIEGISNNRNNNNNN